METKQTKSINVFLPKFRKEEILSHIEECLDKGWTGIGYKTVEFEEAWKAYTKMPHAHFINSNTAGLHLAVKILKHVNQWKEGDEIITTPITFVSTNHSILYEGLKPIFADVDDQLCLDPVDVESKITRKTRAILFTGVGGNIGQYNQIKQICNKHGLKFIFDAAHCAGTKVHKTFEGMAQEAIQVGWDADVAVFSFQAVKNLPTADSGMICFSNKDYDTLARKMSWLGIDKDTYSRTNSKGTYLWDYDVPMLGFKYNGNSIMASMGLVGLKYLDTDNNRRREIATLYDKELETIPQITIVRHSNDCISARHLYQIRVKNRDNIMEYLNTHNIYPGVHYKDNTAYPLYKDGYGTCPTAHRISKELITLPIHCHLTNEDCLQVVRILKEAIKLWY
jgi:dTDP-4-amino-4,6-dideoxygalactose transaminase